ncbi:MAG: hypothetical protein PHD76_05325 [Methylacidiphilales bacterium]|nr:hypothetical protein [Candidatus Methylacidiphilales bacterium]
MNALSNSAELLIERIRRKAPGYLDLLAATTDAEFETAFDEIMGPAVARLEENKRNFENLDENGLTAVLAGYIAVPCLDVVQEKNSNGHVDITIELLESTPVRKMLGEAKIYNGYEYHIGGLRQLIERYSTGREGRGLLIIYVKKKNIAGLIRNLRQKMDEALPCEQQGNTAEHVHKWSFCSKHAHSSGESLEVGHIGCNLFDG